MLLVHAHIICMDVSCACLQWNICLMGGAMTHAGWVRTVALPAVVQFVQTRLPFLKPLLATGLGGVVGG